MIHHAHIISRINESAAIEPPKEGEEPSAEYKTKWGYHPLVTCPSCKGTKTTSVRGRGGLGALSPVHCTTCGGSGSVRQHESLGLTPNAGVSTMAGDVASGDSGSIAVGVDKKEGDEYKEGDPEERQEIKIADAILQAASGLADSPAADEIKRQAQELKRIHGVQ